MTASAGLPPIKTGIEMKSSAGRSLKVYRKGWLCTPGSSMVKDGIRVVICDPFSSIFAGTLDPNCALFIQIMHCHWGKSYGFNKKGLVLMTLAVTVPFWTIHNKGAKKGKPLNNFICLLLFSCLLYC